MNDSKRLQKKGNKEQNQLIQQTEQQRNPGLAKPEDWTVTTASEAAKRQLPGDGHCGKDEAEYYKLLEQANQGSNSSPLGGGHKDRHDVEDVPNRPRRPMRNHD